jgi:hypothetical protein
MDAEAARISKLWTLHSEGDKSVYTPTTQRPGLRRKSPKRNAAFEGRVDGEWDEEPPLVQVMTIGPTLNE